MNCLVYRVLIVDDNRLVTKPLSKLLHAAGYEVKIAHKAIEALEIIKDFMPKVVLIDIKMPGIDGYDLAKEIRSNEDFLETVLVAFTGSCHMQHKLKARKAGFDHHLKKPSSITEIRRILNAYDF